MPDQFEPVSDSRNIGILGSARSHETEELKKLFESRFRQKFLYFLASPAASVGSVRALNVSVYIPKDSSQPEFFLNFFCANADRPENLGQPEFCGLEIMGGCRLAGWEVGTFIAWPAVSESVFRVVSVEWFFEVCFLGLYGFFHSLIFVPGSDRSSPGIGQEIIRFFLSYSYRRENTLAMGRKGTQIIFENGKAFGIESGVMEILHISLQFQTKRE
jgi:hypothetical protein